MNPNTLPPTQDFELGAGAPTPDTRADAAGTAPLAEALGRLTPAAQGDDPGRTAAYAGRSDMPMSFPTVPGFLIEAELGRGGMGVVYRAKQLGLDRAVALKMILRADFASAEQKLRFQIEAENAARVQHPNIVQVHEVGEHRGQPYFALEFVEGGTLADHLRSHRFSPAEAAALIETLARAVHAAHLQGIIHRDLKPANILLRESVEAQERDSALAQRAPTSTRSHTLTPKIADFGLAKRMDSAQELTGSGAVLGTPAYMAPEQARGDTKHVGPAADQYALGVIFYQLLTGAVPFAAKAVPELFRKIAEDEPAPPRSQRPEVPLDLQVICLKALAKEPARRYPSAEALADDLRNWRERRPIAARPATRLERVAKWCRRYPAVAALIAVSVLAALLASGLAWWAMAAERDAKAATAAETSAKLIARKERDDKELARQHEEQERKYAQAIYGFLRNDFLALTSVEGQSRFVPNAEAALSKDTTLRQLLDRAADKLEQRQDLDPRVEADLRWMIAVNLRYHAQHRRAAEFLEKCVAARQRHLGAYHKDTLNAQNSLAVAHAAAGDMPKAIAVYRQVSEAQSRKLGADHPDTLTTLGNLAEALREAGRPAEAIPLFLQVRAGQTRALGEDNPETLATKDSLAGAYHDLGQFAESTALFKSVAAGRTAALGPEHPDTLRTQGNLAVALRSGGKSAEAAALFAEVWPIQRRVLGPDHVDTLRTGHNLAVARRTLGALPEASALLEEVREARERTLGAEHPDTLETLAALASAWQAAGRRADAVGLLQRVWDGRVRKLGADHPATLNALDHLAAAQWSQKRFDLSVPLFAELLRRQEAKHGRNHPATQKAVANLGVNHKDAGRLAEALPLLEEAYAFSRAQASLNWVEAPLLDAYLKTGAKAKVADLAREALAEARRSPGQRTPAAAERLTRFGRTMLQAGDPAAAESCLREALAIRTETQAETWLMFNTQAMLGAALLRQKRFADAETQLAKAYAGFKQAKAPIADYPGSPARQRAADAGELLADVHDATGRTAEAAKLRAEAAAFRLPPKPPGR